MLCSSNPACGGSHSPRLPCFSRLVRGEAMPTQRAENHQPIVVMSRFRALRIIPRIGCMDLHGSIDTCSAGARITSSALPHEQQQQLLQPPQRDSSLRVATWPSIAVRIALALVMGSCYRDHLIVPPHGLGTWQMQRVPAPRPTKTRAETQSLVEARLGDYVLTHIQATTQSRSPSLLNCTDDDSAQRASGWG
jgi:hypothetical protein